MERWVTTWAYAQRSTKYTRWENQNGFEITVPNNLYGSAVRFKYSNMYNPHTVGVRQVKLHLLDVNGREQRGCILSEDFSVAYKESIYSQIEECNVAPGMRFKADILFAEKKNPMTGNTFNGYLAMILQSIEVLTDTEVSVLACFGDSLTHQGMWTTPMIKRLYRRYPGKVAAFEMGITGNRLLRDSTEYANTLGVSGMKRLRHDVLELEGISHVILALGINDIGLPGTERTSITEMPELKDMIQGYTSMVEELKRREIQPIAATITPRNWQGAYEKERENLRLKFNGWILEKGLIDEVIDFSALLIQDGKSSLKKEYDCGDGIHINRNAGLKLQETIDVSKFIRENISNEIVGKSDDE